MVIIIYFSVIVDDGVQFGDGCCVWYFVYILVGVCIGCGCFFGQNVYVGNDVCIGDNVKIQNNVFVYDVVMLEDDVFCGLSMVFINVYNLCLVVVCKDEYCCILVKQGVMLGVNSIIVCGIIVGCYVFIGVGVVINCDVFDFVLMVGVFVRQIGWMSCFGECLELLLVSVQFVEVVCLYIGDCYVLRGQ